MTTDSHKEEVAVKASFCQSARFAAGLAAACLIIAAPVQADTTTNIELAYSPTSANARIGNSIPSLRERLDPSMQQELESALTRMKLAKAARKQQVGVALADITNPDQPRVAAINADHMVYAASLPKIGILLGAFDAINKGNLAYTSDTQKSLTRMIRNSSNRAATEMLLKVGKRNLANLLQSDQYRLYDRDHNGGLWVGREYAKGNPAIRDPLHNISHGATPMQVARFYYLLENGQLVSEAHSREMKKILGNPAINHKFVKALNAKRPGSKIFRKSGSWKTYHSDSAIVERDGRRYIAVALANSAQGGNWLEKLIVEMDDIVFSSPATAGAQVAALH